MFIYIIKRILWCFPVIFGAIFIVFSIKFIDPGDPVAVSLGASYTQEQYDAKAKEMGLDQPFWTQFGTYVKKIVTEVDFGTSYVTKRPIATEIKVRIGTTMKLAFISIVIAVAAGLPFGIISATKQYSWADKTVTVASLFFAAMPGFWLALMLMLLFALNLRVLPASGLGGWKYWVLPAISSGTVFIAVITRMTRSSMLDVVRQDYMRTARAKGLKESTVIMKHGVKNALIPIITVIGFQFGMMVAGSIIIETIFSLPGLGTLMLSAINNRDYPVIQGCVIVLAALVCVINLIIDLAYGFVDPRIMEQMKTRSGKSKRVKKRKGEAAAL